MNRFLDDIANALDHSRRKADERRIQAAVALERELPVFARDKLEKGPCKASAARLSAAVERAIDPLALRKDDRSYVFRSSLQTRIKRYFKGIKTNPAEAKRFARETALHAQKVQRGKFAASVPPINLIDTQKELDGIVASLEALRADFLSRPAGAGGGSAREQAAEMVRYLKERSSEYAFRMSKGLAKHRALSMMDEVGIPEPHRRFKQYPFELSGGMRQRIVIAIALSANPDILICDEPTTALDVTIQAQILELINNLKVNRRLSVIFITHDLGVVANMADKIAVMYAGRIVEYGTAEDIFYDPRHPYTWALLSSMPDLETREKLEAIPGTPPDMIYPPSGDAFAPRNHYALAIDFEEAPPFFRVSDTHMAATWLLHPDAPKVSPPPIVRERIERMQQAAGAHSSHLSAKEENGLENS
ncbi:MAG: ABC transporter ATP-binding protein [Clostridia bacterium]|nr:ABC transporter ATP-binding protein [Clostridia bacterium]